MATVPTASALGDMAEQLLPFAAELIMAVREDGRDEVASVVRRHLGLDASMGPEVATAIAAMVVLAAHADPDRPQADALSWVTWDEHGLTIPQTRRLVAL